MNADLPTLAAPITYTSRPRRSRRMAATAAGTPAPLLLLTCTWVGEEERRQQDEGMHAAAAQGQASGGVWVWAPFPVQRLLNKAATELRNRSTGSPALKQACSWAQSACHTSLHALARATQHSSLAPTQPQPTAGQVHPHRGVVLEGGTRHMTTQSSTRGPTAIHPICQLTRCTDTAEMRLKAAKARSHSAISSGLLPAGSKSTLVPISMMGLLPVAAEKTEGERVSVRCRRAPGPLVVQTSLFAQAKGCRLQPHTQQSHARAAPSRGHPTLTNQLPNFAQNGPGCVQQVHQQHHQRPLLLHHPGGAEGGTKAHKWVWRQQRSAA